MAKKLKPMVRLSKEQIEQKKLFIEHYIEADNPAKASAVDANSNVVKKTVSTLGAELQKDFNIQINRSTMYDYIQKMFDTETADKYIEMLESHVLYKHDETSPTPGTPYCVSISMYPFLEHGMVPLGGESKAPKHLESFCGSFINLCFAISSQFAGAVATVEFLMYFHHFAKKDYGKDYLNTHTDIIKSKLQHLVYSLNQPAAARGYQSIFWNISIFDRHFFNSMFSSFMFPDGTAVDYDELHKLQMFFMNWFHEERKRALLTFPVITEASLNENGKPKDMDFARDMAKLRAKGLSFFSYNDDDAAALSSCCRMKNAIDFNEFSYSLGAGGVATGSTGVMTLNINRFIQLEAKEQNEKNFSSILPKLSETIDTIQKFHVAHRQIVNDYIEAGLLPAFTTGYISTDKQFVTNGISGINEAAEFMDIEVSYNPAYVEFLCGILQTYKDCNKAASKQYGIKFNTELVPGESLGVKNANWDKADGLEVPRDCYNSYLYLSESASTSIPDKFKLHGDEVTQYLDGGSALHLNISQLPDEEFFLWLRMLAAKYKTTYWTTNVRQTCCEDCGTIDFRTLDECPSCGSKNISYASRTIGYLRKIASYGKGRKEEALERFYH